MEVARERRLLWCLIIVGWGTPVIQGDLIREFHCSCSLRCAHCKYRTSGMAEDAICLLDYLGWTGERELNVVGISLGGMIAQGM